MILSKSLGHMTVRQALELIVRVAANNDAVEFEGHWYAPKELARVLSGLQRLSEPAEGLPVYFYGGPPGKTDFFKGSLRTYAIDLLFRLECDYNEYDLLIDFCNETLPAEKRPTLKQVTVFHD